MVAIEEASARRQVHGPARRRRLLVPILVLLLLLRWRMLLLLLLLVMVFVVVVEVAVGTQEKLVGRRGALDLSSRPGRSGESSGGPLGLQHGAGAGGCGGPRS